jgi:hypothetical protein
MLPLDLRGYLSWCADRDVDPLAATRVQVLTQEISEETWAAEHEQ